MADSFTYPTGQQYREALFNTGLAFKDPDLRGGEPLTDPLGMPKPIGGNFATVFTIQGTDGRCWAVKCFTRHVPDRDARYQKISAALQGATSSWKVGFEYLSEGVQCRGTWYPVLKMEWVEATTLLPFVEAHLTDEKELVLLAARFRGVVRNLAHHGIAHGDLQHGNILVLPSGELKLIDYDGMYVPGLDAVGGSELGHPNYQSPHRSSKDWGPDMDRFSAWVIYTSLSALALDPSLWHELHAGDEALLFHKDDFANRLSSRARQALVRSSNSVVRELATDVAFLWSPDLTAIPLLEMAQPPNKPASVNPVPAATLPDWLRHNLAVGGAANVGGHWRQAVAEAEIEIIRLENALDEIIREFDSVKCEIQNEADETRAILKQQYEAAKQQEVDEIMAIDSRLNAIIKKKQSELAKALAILQQAYISQRLGKKKIPKHTIPGIGPETVSSLAESGILTAADFTEVFYLNGHTTITLWDGRKVQPPGIGPRRAEALAAWRFEMGKRARANQPTVLPKREYDAIVGKQARSLAYEKKTSSARAEAKKEALCASLKELDTNVKKEIDDIESFFSEFCAETEAELAAAHQKLESAKRQLRQAATPARTPEIRVRPRLVRNLTGHTADVVAVAFSPDGTLLATASSNDGTARLWDAATGRAIRTLTGHTGYFFAVAFSPDGTLLATASSNDGTARLWDAATGRAIRTLTGHTSFVNQVAFSPDGTLLATASSDKTARLWDTATRRAIRTLTGHTDNVKRVAFSPDGTLLATAGGDKTARLWDAATGRAIRTLTGHTSVVNQVAFSPDGTLLATASSDKTARLWALG